MSVPTPGADSTPDRPNDFADFVTTAPWHEGRHLDGSKAVGGYEATEVGLDWDYRALEVALAAAPLVDWRDSWKYKPWPGVAPMRSRRIFWLARRDGLACRYCRRKLLASTATIDHCIPRFRGGSDRYDNLCLACLECNSHKGTRTELEYLAVLALAA